MPKKLDKWMAFDIGDYMADTMDLSTVQHGAYILLLMRYMRKGPLPDDDSTLAQITKQPHDEWMAMSFIIRSYFKLNEEDGLLHQKRADHEILKRVEISEKRSAAGRAGVEVREARKRDGYFRLEPQEANASVLHDVCQTHNTVTSTEESPPSPLEKAPPSREKAQGSSIAADWRPPADEWQFAIDKGIVDPEETLSMFRDYWLGKVGKDGRKADWPATWRNWCRREAERLKSRRPGTAELPFLTPIAGGKATDPNDDWGIEGFCASLPGVIAITDQKYHDRGKWEYEKVIIDYVAKEIAKACRFDRREWRGEWALLADWLREGVRSDIIIATVQRGADYYRQKNSPATTLRAFDRSVRERKAA